MRSRTGAQKSPGTSQANKAANIAVALIAFFAAALPAMAKDKAGAWYPRTEKVGPDEMFVVALGTGMPTPITRAQKSTAWYVELGNGDIFLFDVGSGSSENLFALRPDFARVDKAFMSHLHTDQVGDTDALWIGGCGMSHHVRVLYRMPVVRLLLMNLIFPRLPSFTTRTVFVMVRYHGRASQCKTRTAQCRRKTFHLTSMPASGKNIRLRHCLRSREDWKKHNEYRISNDECRRTTKAKIRNTKHQTRNKYV